MTPNFRAITEKVGCKCHVWGAISVTDDTGVDHQRFINVRDLSNYATYARFTIMVSSHQHPWITAKVELGRDELFSTATPAVPHSNP
jgi:hypothetical protein